MTAITNREYAATIVSTGGAIHAPAPSGITLAGNHRSHCTICPAAYVVRSAGSAPRNNGRSNATRARSTEDEPVHPTRSPITVAGMSGNCPSNSRIAGSNASTAEPAGLRWYFGGSCAANATRTVFRAIPNRRAIVLIPNPSARCSRRISAQSSTVITPPLFSEGGSTFARRQGVSLHAASTGATSRWLHRARIAS